MRQLLWAALLMLAGGCFFEPYRETVRYDLDGPEGGGAVRVRAEEFRNHSGSDRKIRFRSADGRILTDPAATWAQSPEAMVPQAINSAFAGLRADTPVRRLSGTLDRFDADLGAKQFRLEGSFRFRDSNKEYFFRIHEPLTADTPAAVAAAANRAVARLIAQIRTDAAGQETNRPL